MSLKLQEDNLRAPQAKFNSDLANVIFGAPPPPERAAEEAEITEQLLKRVGKLTSPQLFRVAPYIDGIFIGLLSGANMLKVAKAIESKSPAAIPLMPNLDRNYERLRQAALMARVLNPGALRRLVGAINVYAAKQPGGASGG